MNNRWNYFETECCALLRYYHHWIFYVALTMPRVCVGFPRGWQHTPLQLHSYDFILWVSLPWWPISLLPSVWTIYFSQIILLIVLNNFQLSCSYFFPTHFFPYLSRILVLLFSFHQNGLDPLQSLCWLILTPAVPIICPCI